MEYLTSYPKTISFFDGLVDKITADSKEGVEQLTLVVKKNVEELMKIFSKEGFTKVKFEHKHPFQIGNGLSLKLKKTMGDARQTSRYEKRTNCYSSRSRSIKRLSTASILSKDSGNLRNGITIKKASN